MLGVGDSLELPYVLGGALPAGSYHVHVAMNQVTPIGGSLHVALALRRSGSDGGADAPVAALDVPIVAATGQPTEDGVQIDATADGDVTAAAVPARCGDLLVFTLLVLPGTSGLQPLPHLDLP